MRSRDEYKHIRDLLTDWGFWLQQGIKALDYPSETAESRMRVELAPTKGGHKTVSGRETRSLRPQTPGYMPNKRIAAVDMAIQNAQGDLKKLAISRYAKEMTEIELIKMLKVKKSKLYQELNKLHAFVDGWIKSAKNT